MAKGFQSLPGFRDFRPEDCAVRNYLFANFREVARRYGFVEYETPLLEPTELYEKKAGGELNSQLFCFTDKGGRDVTLRPEVTASLGRLVGAVQRNYPKPLRWFEIGQCFRYEKPQKGRTREFYQFNVDLLGESTAGADAELIALSIDLMRELGFVPGDFVIRLSDRAYWQEFGSAKGLSEEQTADLLGIVDKLEREKPEVTEEKLQTLGLSTEAVKEAIKNPASLGENLDSVLANLEARGMSDFIEVDLSIVRGLAYYTGVVFEVFDAKKSLRAVAGGGRYDTLISALSDGGTDLPAAGFAIGDVVIRHLIEETPHAAEKMASVIQEESGCDIYLVLADDSQQAKALALSSKLRSAGLATTFSLTPAKVGKQFKQAEQAGASIALVVGSEYPELSAKILATRAEETLSDDPNLVETLSQLLKK
ncbi:histidine--tRNA ligase [Akkermansiaceae bacterium]|nr:histidine--tRNA ligase [Akkermansiaceae bacterium]